MLNHIILLHCHKDLTDSLDIVAVANEFVDLLSHRLGIFGRFKNEDYMAVGFCGRCKKSWKCSSCTVLILMHDMTVHSVYILAYIVSIQ